jgi:hypothetical protein
MIFPLIDGDKPPFPIRGELFIGVHDETLSIVAVCVCDKYRSAFAVHRCDATPRPSSFAEIVRDSLPVPFHAT